MAEALQTQQTFLVFQDVFKTSWRRLQRSIFRLPRPLDLFTKRLPKTSSRRLQDVFLKRIQDVFKTSSKCLPRRLQDVLKTSSRRVCKKSCNYVFKTSSRNLPDVLEDKKMFKSNRPQVFLGKGVLNICSKFTGDHPYRSAISTKLLCNFIEIALRHRWSLVNWLHIFRTPFPKNTSGWLLLNVTMKASWRHLQDVFSTSSPRRIFIRGILNYLCYV